MEKNDKTWLWTVIFGGNEKFMTYNCIKVENVQMIAIGFNLTISAKMAGLLLDMVD